MPAVAAVHGTARASAVRAAAARPSAAGVDTKKVWAVWRDCLDAAAQHGTKVVHALSDGHDDRFPQTSM